MEFGYTIEIDFELVDLRVEVNGSGEWDARLKLGDKWISFYERLTTDEERDIDILVEAECKAAR